MKSLLIYIQRLILQLSSLHVYNSSKIHDLQIVAPPHCKDHLGFFFLLKYPVPKVFRGALVFEGPSFRGVLGLGSCLSFRDTPKKTYY